MILGMGIELLDVPRFRCALERFDARLRTRVFTDGERAYARARHKGEVQSLAVRFAAKCAAKRALAAARARVRTARERSGGTRSRWSATRAARPRFASTVARITWRVPPGSLRCR